MFAVKRLAASRLFLGVNSIPNRVRWLRRLRLEQDAECGRDGSDNYGSHVQIHSSFSHPNRPSGRNGPGGWIIIQYAPSPSVCFSSRQDLAILVAQPGGVAAGPSGSLAPEEA